MRALLLALALLATTVVLAAAPAAGSCVHQTVGFDGATFADIATAGPGPGPICRTSATAYLCTARSFGGGGDILENIVWDCRPLVTVP